MTHQPELEDVHAWTEQWLKQTYSPNVIFDESKFRTDRRADYHVKTDAGKDLIIEVGNEFHYHGAGQAGFYKHHNPDKLKPLYVVPKAHVDGNDEELEIMKSLMEDLGGELVVLDENAQRWYK